MVLPSSPERILSESPDRRYKDTTTHAKGICTNRKQWNHNPAVESLGRCVWDAIARCCLRRFSTPTQVSPRSTRSPCFSSLSRFPDVLGQDPTVESAKSVSAALPRLSLACRGLRAFIVAPLAQRGYRAFGAGTQSRVSCSLPISSRAVHSYVAHDSRLEPGTDETGLTLPSLLFR